MGDASKWLNTCRSRCNEMNKNNYEIKSYTDNTYLTPRPTLLTPLQSPQEQQFLPQSPQEQQFLPQSPDHLNHHNILKNNNFPQSPQYPRTTIF